MALTLQQLKAVITADDRDYQRGMQRVERRGQETAQKVKRSFEGMQIKSPSFIGGLAGGLAGSIGGNLLGGLLDIPQRAFTAGKEYIALLERTRVGFTLLSGSASLTERHLKSLEAFAIKSPFEFPDIIKASQQLQSFGNKIGDVERMLPAISDAAAAASLSTGNFGEAIQSVVRALGQMQARGKVSLEEINQLTEAGVPALEILARKLGKSTDELTKLIETGKVKGKPAVALITEGFSEAFGGLSEKLGETISGKESTAADAFRKLAGEGFKGVQQQYKDFLDTLSKAAENPKVVALVQGFGSLAGGALGTANKLLNAQSVEEAAGILKDAGKKIFEGFVGFLPSATDFMQGLGRKIFDGLVSGLPALVGTLTPMLQSLGTEVGKAVAAEMKAALTKEGGEVFSPKKDVDDLQQIGRDIQSGNVTDDTKAKIAEQVMKAMPGGVISSYILKKMGLYDAIRDANKPKFAVRDMLMLSGQGLFQQRGQKPLSPREQDAVFGDPRRQLRPPTDESLLPPTVGPFPGDIIQVLPSIDESLKQIAPTLRELTPPVIRLAENAQQPGDVRESIGVRGELERVEEATSEWLDTLALTPPKLIDAEKAAREYVTALDQVTAADRKRIREALGGDITKELQASLQNSFDDFTSALIYGRETIGDALRQLASGVIGDTFAAFQKSVTQELLGTDSIGEYLGKVIGELFGRIIRSITERIGAASSGGGSIWGAIIGVVAGAFGAGFGGGGAAASSGGGGGWAGGFADGGLMRAGMFGLVGERGPEPIFALPGGGVRVFSNQEAQQSGMFGSRNVSININVGARGGEFQTPKSRRQLGRAIATEVRGALRFEG